MSYTLYEIPYEELPTLDITPQDVKRKSANSIEATSMDELMGKVVSGINDQELSDENYWYIVKSTNGTETLIHGFGV